MWKRSRSCLQIIYCSQIKHEIIITNALNVMESFSERVAIRLNAFSFAKKHSTKCLSLYICRS